MSELLKVNNNAQILDIAPDRPEANRLDCPGFERRAAGHDKRARASQYRPNAPQVVALGQHTSVQGRGYVFLYNQFPHNQPNRKHR
jgi:hypothetical protein